jgi:hypothetical protein
VGLVVSHPRRKNKDAPRMGHRLVRGSTLEHQGPGGQRAGGRLHERLT